MILARPPNMEIVLASSNTHKVQEILEIWGPVPLRILTLKDFPSLKPIDETGKTFEENALIKARALFEYTGLGTIADDSGLEVDALAGEPGIYSARYAGEPSNDQANLEKVVRNLWALNPHQWGDYAARFICVAAWISPEGIEKTFRGAIEGKIISTSRGAHGFGYDPIFYVPQLGKTTAELTPLEKNAISHRSKAFLALKSYLFK